MIMMPPILVSWKCTVYVLSSTLKIFGPISKPASSIVLLGWLHDQTKLSVRQYVSIVVDWRNPRFLCESENATSFPRPTPCLAEKTRERFWEWSWWKHWISSRKQFSQHEFNWHWNRTSHSEEKYLIEYNFESCCDNN